MSYTIPNEFYEFVRNSNVKTLRSELNYLCSLDEEQHPDVWERIEIVEKGLVEKGAE